MRAYRGMRTFREGSSSFRPWLLKIVVNQAITLGKSRQRRARLAERAAQGYEPPVYSIDETVISRERAELIYRALESLSEHERAVVYLRYFIQLPESELAEYLGCAPGTVKSRLHRALEKLRGVIARDYPELTKDVIA
jgi:RNA polymerase sigma-70 factor (ECF subfamily)